MILNQGKRRVALSSLPLNKERMKVKILRTGEIKTVTPERGNYWIRCKWAVEVKGEPKKDFDPQEEKGEKKEAVVKPKKKTVKK